jgi:hypothetical protein
VAALGRKNNGGVVRLEEGEGRKEQRPAAKK